MHVGATDGRPYMETHLTQGIFPSIMVKNERRESMKIITKHRLKKLFLFITNPRLLLCLGLGWMITNGWSYVLFALGTLLKNQWMLGISGAYLAFLWFPFSPEKLATVAIAIGLLKWLFPRDEKTLAVLVQMKEKVKTAVKKKKEEKDKR